MHNNNLIFFGTILFAILVLKDPCVGFYEPSKFIIKTKKTDDKVTIQIEKNLKGLRNFVPPMKKKSFKQQYSPQVTHTKSESGKIMMKS